MRLRLTVSTSATVSLLSSSVYYCVVLSLVLSLTVLCDAVLSTLHYVLLVLVCSSV